MKRGGKNRKKRMFVLAYADDVVLLAKEEGGLRLIVGELKNYLKEKGLDVNAGKPKIIRFGKKVRNGRKGSESGGEMRLRKLASTNT